MKTKLFLIALSCFVLHISGYSQDQMMDILKSEIAREYSELQKCETQPYYMNFRVEEIAETSIAANFGSLIVSNSNRSANFMSHIRLGDPDFDSYLGVNSMKLGGLVKPAALPVDGKDAEAAIRMAIWNDVNARYKVALGYFESVKANADMVKKQQDNAPNFSFSDTEKYYEKPLTETETALDKKAWEEKLRRISAIGLKDKNIVNFNSSLSFKYVRSYFVGTDGAEVAHNLTYCRVMVDANIEAEDGMLVPLYLLYFAYTPDGIPSEEDITRDANEMVEKLRILRDAPIVQSGKVPALLHGDASGVFFHEIFGHRIEAQPMKSNLDAQTFKNMVGSSVLPSVLSVYDDPTLTQYEGQDLNGYYKFDEQGMRAERVEVVKDGILRDFLATRSPLEGFTRTNGHGRAQMGFDPTSRQSNLIVEVENPRTEAELRAMLLDEIRKQGTGYGYYFKQVTGGLTMTSATNVSSLQVDPLEVYKVYPDGRPDELVRGVKLIGTPLSVFANIIEAGGEPRIFTGMCGAASGYVPVTAIAPMILVNTIEVQRVPDSMNIPIIIDRP